MLGGCACSATARSRSCSAGRRERAGARGQAAPGVPRPGAARALRGAARRVRRPSSSGAASSVLPTEAARGGAARRRARLPGPAASCRARRCSTACCVAAPRRARGAWLLGRLVDHVVGGRRRARRPRRPGRELGGRRTTGSPASTSRRRCCATRGRPRTSSTSSLFLSVYPWALRRRAGAASRTRSWASTTTPARCCVDVASNLVKERLERWLPAFLERGQRARRARRSTRPRCAATSPATSACGC